jgi:hypothetical protein
MRPGWMPTAAPGSRRTTAVGTALAAGSLVLATATATAAGAATESGPLTSGVAAKACSAPARGAVGGANVEIDAIAAGPSCSALAAGTNSSGATVVFAWNGSAWRHMTTFSGGNGGDLYAVTAPSAAATWAVGEYVDSTVSDQTLIERDTSKGWITYASPDPAGTAANNDLYGVAASGGSAWAVGTAQTASASGSVVLILGWNGSRWVVARAPKLARDQSSALFSVAAASSTSAWAVGTATSGSVARPLIERYLHGGWSVVASPSVSGELESVTVVSAKNAWAVGFRAAGGTDTTLIEHWNGSKWSVVSSPNVRRVDASTANDQLRGVAAISAGNAYAVGVAAPAHSAVEQTLILHWNGHSWARVSSPDPAGTSGINDLQGAAAGGGGCWMAGTYLTSKGAAHSFALHR